MWDIWNLFKISVTEPLRIFCYITSFAVPYIIYKVNMKLHEIGDPPWKKNE